MNENSKRSEPSDCVAEEKRRSVYSFQTYLTILVPIICLLLLPDTPAKSFEQVEKERKCFETCTIRIVETIPSNVSFADVDMPMSTYEAWNRLITNARDELHIAAYKSSLQGKHVLGDMDRFYSNEGDDIYNSLMTVGRTGGVKIRMVENFPPKDKGDNADGIILQNFGAVSRKSIDISKHLGHGKMHSKFLVADKKNFYLGSANLDWRSLNQKMELGVLVENCECLGEDMQNIFDVLWRLGHDGVNSKALNKKAEFNMHSPLKVQVQGEPAEVYVATSPKALNHRDRTWDLDAIVHEIDSAKEFLDVHVMDYFPLFVYRKPQTHFDDIDDAIRRAVVRGVRVRLLAAALHYPDMGTRFLRSLQSLNHITKNASMQVKIFKVPKPSEENMVISRERRTHNKFMITESAVVIGTSNWSGDYFVGGTTGCAIVVKQLGDRRPIVNEMKDIFERDWESSYAHPLDEYFRKCVESNEADFCEQQKDPRLFASPQSIE